MSQEEEDEDMLHIGNTIGIHSAKYGYTKGRIVYRSLELVRVMPDEASDRAIDFPMTADGSGFAPEIGATAVDIFETQSSPYYVDFLGARPGELLEFFTTDGTEAAPPGEVKAVVKTDEEDSIELKDGRVLEFAGAGPPDPIAVIRVRTAINAAAAPQEGEEAVPEETVAAAAREHSIMALLRSVLPTAAVEIIPTAERTYPDSIQREGLFQDLLANLSAKKQTNPRHIRLLEREVDLAVALKNRSIQRDQSGRIIGSSPYLITTVSDAVSQGPVPSAVPVVQGARVLNLDNAQTAGFTYKDSDVAPRSLPDTESQSETLAARYLEGGETNFVGYIYDLLGRDLSTFQGTVDGNGWSTDQDVFRTASLNAKVEGLSKDLPEYDEKKSPPVTLTYKINDVLDRSIRLLTADRRTYLKTGAVSLYAPSDPNNVSSYIILPPKAALTMRPPIRSGHLPTALLYSAALESDNLPTVAQTLRDLYSQDSDSPLNSWTLTADAAAAHPIADWLNSVLRYTVHPVDSLGPRGPALLSLLDTLGVGVTDLAPPVTAVINEWVSTAQKTWISLLKARRATIQTSLDAEQPRTFQSADSPLWAALRTADTLKELVDDIGRRNPTINGAPTMLTASLLVEAQGDATPLVWAEIAKLDSRELAAIDIVSAADALGASRAYTLRRAALRSREMLELHAAPEINTCPHAARLEAIRNLTDVPERSRMLRAFIEEFQGPATGDWISCVLCKKECVCYHELMELEALAQPQRLDAIQKQILIKFGGDRYEGKIICKNCGQGLQEIDFDEHVEFDDNGKPIQQASVLTDEQMDGDNATSSWKKSVANLAPDITFESQSHREIAEGLTDLLMHARLNMAPDVFRRIVTYTDIYTGRRQPDEAKYNELLQKKAKMATTKFKKTTGVEGVTIDLPTFAETVDQLRVSALMAFVAIAIQSQEVTISTPLPICKFSREGYPFNPKAKPDEPGALLYMACAAADIKQKKKPWLSLTWVGDTKFETRQKKALQIAYTAVNTILGVDEKAGVLSFTSQVRTDLTRVQTDVVAAKERALVSVKDELPPGFRPEPRPTDVRVPATERDPLPALQAAIEKGFVSTKTTNEIGEAVRNQAIAAIVGLHEATKATTREGMCCPAEIGVIEGGIVGRTSLSYAAQMLRQTNPTAVNTGTHLWPTLETPHDEPVEQAVDETVLFKLFLKFCYQGHAVGNPHEFSVGNICRQCELMLGKPFDLIDFGKEGAAILASQQGSLKIEVTRVAFDALSDAARRRKLITPDPSTVIVDRSGLAKLVGLCDANLATAEIGAILRDILTAPVEDDPVGRAATWGALSAHAGAILRATKIDKTMLETMTEDPFIEGPRALQEYWCAKVNAAGSGFAVTTVDGARWFKISEKHNDLIDKILDDNASWYAGTVSDRMKPVLQKISRTLGPLLSLWVSTIRPDPRLWSVAEAQLLLRSLVVQVWGDALTATSWMYADIGESAERMAIAEDIRAWTVALMDFKKGPKDDGHRRGHVQLQFIKYSKEAVKRILQQRSELERTSVVEEFESIKDDDLKAAEYIKKQFRIGRWGVGKNLQKYDADLFEFEHDQRQRMGVVEAPVEPGLAPVPGAEAPPVFVEQEAGYAVDQGADGDDY